MNDKIEAGHTAVWLRACELMAEKVECDGPYDEPAFSDFIRFDLRPATMEPLDQFIDEMTRGLAHLGIILVTFPRPPKSKVLGATRLSEHAVIALPEIGKTEADFWWAFTLQAVYLLDYPDYHPGEFRCVIEGVDQSGYRAAAMARAQDLLLPGCFAAQIPYAQTPEELEALAQKACVSPSILLDQARRDNAARKKQKMSALKHLDRPIVWPAHPDFQ